MGGTRVNLPNKITLFRVCLIPVFLYVYLAAPLPESANMWLALSIFSVASITDAIDGYLARRYKLITNFGKLMDPLADKLLVCAALVAFASTGTLPAWAVIVMISREIYQSGLRQLALEQGKVLAASLGAKLKTITQMVLIIYLLVPISFLRFDIAVSILLWASVVASVLTAVDYTYKNLYVFEGK